MHQQERVKALLKKLQGSTTTLQEIQTITDIDPLVVRAALVNLQREGVVYFTGKEYGLVADDDIDIKDMTTSQLESLVRTIVIGDLNGVVTFNPLNEKQRADQDKPKGLTSKAKAASCVAVLGAQRTGERGLRTLMWPQEKFTYSDADSEAFIVLGEILAGLLHQMPLEQKAQIEKALIDNLV